MASDAVRTFRAHRDYPRRFPFDRYRGKGDRIILVELEGGSHPRAVASHASTRSWLEDSVCWDVRLPYVRREVAENLLIRTKADAEAARGIAEVPDDG